MPQRRNGHPQEKAKPSTDKPINRLPSEMRDTANKVGQQANEALQSAGQRANDMAASLGSGMQSLAGNLRAAAPGQESFGPIASGAADLLERTGRYLQEEGVSGLSNELNQLIRRSPLSAVAVAAGIGFLLAQTMRR